MKKEAFFVVVDIVERSVTTIFWSRVCFCNFRYSLRYFKQTKNTSEITKTQHFLYLVQAGILLA
jgi:hypothetical protein